MTAHSKWLHYLPKRDTAKIRLFCFPYGGASTHIFRSWSKEVSNEIEIIAIKLPGHGQRIKESPLTTWSPLIGELTTVLQTYTDKPYLFFGHSLGACVAFDLVKFFQVKNIPLPFNLIVSGCQCPHVPAFESSIHDLPREEFFTRVYEMNGMPEEVLNNEAMKTMLEPALRADMKLAELWHGSIKDQINVPITAFSGLSDKMALPEAMADWKSYTTKDFFLYEFQGDHFFLHEKQHALLKLISDIIAIDNESMSLNILKELNTSYANYPDDKSIAQLFQKQVKNNPHRIALIYSEQTMTYQMLNNQANQLAHYLIKHGIENEDLVAICLERSLRMFIALLGILKAGGAYLPIDKNYPLERAEYILMDTKARFIITEAHFLNSFPISDRKLINLDNDWNEILTEDTKDPNLSTQPSNLAYVNYTSGTTGKPKGVETLQRGVVSLLFGANYARIDSSRIFLQMSPIGFDAATFEIWGPLLHGGQCVIYPEKWPTLHTIGNAIKNNAVTTVFFTTALFNTIIDENPTILSSIEQVLTGGEAHSVTQIRKALQLLPATQIINVYGPTETTTFATHYSVHYLKREASSIPIGSPINNTQAYVIDTNGNLINKPDVIGELYLGGAGLAKGYLNQPTLSQEKFICDLPYLPENKFVYKTGDSVKYLSNYDLDFIGRGDNQVKIHGFRIEIGEVENTLMSHPRIKQAIVMVENKAYDNKKLIAFLIGSSTDTTNHQLKQYCQKKLPKYMVPNHFYWLDKLPITTNGKIDRKALNLMVEATI